jgi:hypothetical protein
VISLITLPFRLVFGSMRLGWRTGRLVGPSRALFFGTGFAIGVLAVSPKARAAAFGGVAKLTEAIADRRADPPPPDATVLAPVDGPVVSA